MKLAEFLRLKDIKPAEFGKEIDVSAVTVNRYLNETRTPTDEILQKIYTVSGGLVTPNDFHNFVQPSSDGG